MPCWMPIRSFSTLATGARQLVVHEAVGDDLVVLAQAFVVDAVNDGEIGAVAGRRDDHALGPGVEVGGGLVAGGEDAGAFERDVDAQLLVRQFGRVLDRGDFDLARAGVDPILAGLHFAGETAVNAVETEQVGVGLDGAQIVDRHNFEVGAPGFDDGAQDVAPDASETVDGHLHAHVLLHLSEFMGDLASARARVYARKGKAGFNESDKGVTIRRNGEQFPPGR